MLCSISAGKSGSNWLDRLRSSRGFPADHDLNLEQFLNHQNPYFSNSSSDSIFADSTATNNDPNSNNNLTLAENLVLDRKKTTEIRPENGERKWFGIMSSVLSELFIMGESNDYRRKKNSRKLLRPKVCVASTSPNDEYIQTETARSPSSDNNNSKKENTEQAEVLNDVALDLEDVEEDKCHADLSGFSRTEVTVIDTSCGSWKFENMLFRRKNVWKVRDKKWKG